LRGGWVLGTSVTRSTVEMRLHLYHRSFTVFVIDLIAFLSQDSIGRPLISWFDMPRLVSKSRKDRRTRIDQWHGTSSLFTIVIVVTVLITRRKRAGEYPEAGRIGRSLAKTNLIGIR
jgi:hypothetical protein